MITIKEAEAKKFRNWFIASGTRGYEIKRLRFGRGFRYKPFVYRDGWWRSAGRRSIFKTISEANRCGNLFIH